MAHRPNGEIVHFNNGVLSVACGKITLKAIAHIASCEGDGCCLEGTITDGPLRALGKQIHIASENRQDAVILIR